MNDAMSFEATAKDSGWTARRDGSNHRRWAGRFEATAKMTSFSRASTPGDLVLTARLSCISRKQARV